jgi:hypothetical protein
VPAASGRLRRVQQILARPAVSGACCVPFSPTGQLNKLQNSRTAEAHNEDSRARTKTGQKGKTKARRKQETVPQNAFVVQRQKIIRKMGNQAARVAKKPF